MQVGKTITNWQIVEANINKMFQDRLQHAHAHANYGVSRDRIAQMIFDELIPPTDYAKMLELGSEYFSTSDNFNVDVTYYTSDGLYHKERYGLQFSSKRLIPPKVAGYYAASVTLTPGSEINSVFCDRRLAVKRVTEEIATFKNKVEAIWDSVPSVNAFVKAWPPGLELLNDDIRERLERKVEKRAKVEIAQTDINELSVHLLKAKIAA